jgi:hypothetical protein
VQIPRAVAEAARGRKVDVGLACSLVWRLCNNNPSRLANPSHRALRHQQQRVWCVCVCVCVCACVRRCLSLHSTTLYHCCCNLSLPHSPPPHHHRLLTHRPLVRPRLDTPVKQRKTLAHTHCRRTPPYTFTLLLATCCKPDSLLVP